MGQSYGQGAWVGVTNHGEVSEYDGGCVAVTLYSDSCDPESLYATYKY